MRKKILLVLNPHSGQKKANSNLINIISLLSSAEYDCSVHVTNRTGDATEYVSAYAQNFDLVVCIGGDGTLNETISGILSSGVDIPLGYIPSGSTNDFANSLGLSKNIIQATKDIITGKPHPCDIGSFNGKHFSYIASFGAFTKASYDTPQNLKNAVGHFAYLMEGLKEVPNIKPTHAKITIDGVEYEDDYIFCSVSNTTSIAGVIMLKEDDVDLNDGLFEVILVKNPKNTVEVSEIAMAFALRQYSSTVQFISAKKICFETSSPQNWTLDGEFEQGGKNIEIINLESAIKIIK